MRIALLVTLLAAVSCGGKSDKTTPDRPAPPDAGLGAPASDGGVARGGADRLGSGECKRFLDHVLAIGRREHEAKVDPKVKPTDAQVETIRAKLRAEDLELCRKLPRPVYECAMRATTSAAFLACQKPAGQPRPAPGDKPSSQVP